MHRFFFNKGMAFSFILDEFTLCDISTSAPITLNSIVSHKTHHVRNQVMGGGIWNGVLRPKLSFVCESVGRA